MKSRGDPLAAEEGCCKGVGALELGGEGSWTASSKVLLALGDSIDDRVTKLGSGRADGAGEAWKVAPANAGPAVDFMDD
jgi:hypothetical protein